MYNEERPFITVKSFSSSTPQQLFLDQLSPWVKSASIQGTNLTEDEQALLQRAMGARAFFMRMQGEYDPGDLTGIVWSQAVRDSQDKHWNAAIVAAGPRGQDFAYISSQEMLSPLNSYYRTNIKALNQQIEREIEKVVDHDNVTYLMAKKELDALRHEQRKHFGVSGIPVCFSHI